MKFDPKFTFDGELSGNFEEIAFVRTVTGDLKRDSNGKILILPNGRTDLTEAWGVMKLSAEHGELSWNARTLGREKFQTSADDAKKMGRRMSRNHPQVIEPDPDTGLKRWRWVINETWNSGKVGAKNEIRQIVYVARQVPDAHRTVELIDRFVSEDDALLPVSEPNPDVVDTVKWFFRELYQRLFHRKDATDHLFPNRK